MNGTGKRAFVLAAAAFILMSVVMASGCVRYEGKETSGKTYGPVTAKEFSDDIVEDNNSFGFYFKTYDAGDKVIVEGNISDVEIIETSYGDFTDVVLDNLVRYCFEGNRTDEYKVGMHIELTISIEEIKMNGIEVESYVEYMPYIIWWVGSGGGYYNSVALDSVYTNDASMKLMVNTLYEKDLSSCEVKILTYNGDKATVADEIDDLSASKKSDYIQFFDCGTKGRLDDEDYFILNMPATGSKTIVSLDSFVLTIDGEDISNTTFVNWYNGICFIEHDEEPQQDTVSIGLQKMGQTGGFYIFNVASLSGSAPISDTIIDVKHEGTVVVRADYSSVTAGNTTEDYRTYESPASGDMIIIIDNDADGYITQGDVIKVDTDLAHTGDVMEVKVDGYVVATQTF